jgi:hypothetical protein
MNTLLSILAIGIGSSLARYGFSSIMPADKSLIEKSSVFLKESQRVILCLTLING